MIIDELFEGPQLCPECGGISFSDLILAEKKDACYHKVKASAKVWPSAYASGRLVQCRKKGAANYGNKSEGVAEGSLEEVSQDTARSYAQKAQASQKDLINQTHRKGADIDKLNKKIQNRQQGLNRAHTDKRYYKDDQGVAEANLSELNKDTVYSYAKKADKDQDKQSTITGKAYLDNDPKTANKAHHKFSMRAAGLDRAKKRLNKEGVAEGSEEYCDACDRVITKKPHVCPGSQGVAEGVTPASTSKVLRLIDRHNPEWFEDYGMGEVEDTVVELAERGEFQGMSAVDAMALVHQELEKYYGQLREQGVAEQQELDEKWSQKYKSSINCANPQGFSQRAHCAGRNKNEDVEESLGKQIHSTFQSMGDSFSDAHLAKGISYFLQGRHQEGENWLRGKIPQAAQDTVFSKLRTLQAQGGVDVNKNANVQQYIDDKLVPWVKNQIQQNIKETRRGQVPMTLKAGETDNLEPENIAAFRKLPAYKQGQAAQQKAGKQLIQQSPYTFQSDQDWAYRQGAFDTQQAAMFANFGGTKPLTTAEGEQQKGADYRDPREVDYDDEYDAMVARVKKLAGLGPMRTVYDPNRRVYRNMPTAVQPKK